MANQKYFSWKETNDNTADWFGNEEIHSLVGVNNPNIILVKGL